MSVGLFVGWFCSCCCFIVVIWFPQSDSFSLTPFPCSLEASDSSLLSQQLALLWSSVLGTTVSPTMDLFDEAGATSLQVLHLGVTTSEYLGCTVSVALLFQCRTIDGVLRELGQQGV